MLQNVKEGLGRIGLRRVKEMNWAKRKKEKWKEKKRGSPTDGAGVVFVQIEQLDG